MPATVETETKAVDAIADIRTVLTKYGFVDSRHLTGGVVDAANEVIDAYEGNPGTTEVFARLQKLKAALGR